jgi:lysozyme
LWTIGVGHVLYPDQGKIPLAERDGYQLKEQDNKQFSPEEVDGILKFDLDRFERGVEKLCPVPLTQGMFDSLTSFSFNVGLGTLQRSTLRQKLLRGDKAGAAEELLKYCMAGGKILKGLQNRRIDERAMFLS